MEDDFLEFMLFLNDTRRKTEIIPEILNLICDFIKCDCGKYLVDNNIAEFKSGEKLEKIELDDKLFTWVKNISYRFECLDCHDKRCEIFICETCKVEWCECKGGKNNIIICNCCDYGYCGKCRPSLLW